MSILNILNIGASALLASQKALDTTAHNIANANTPGYTRQTVDLSSIPGLLNTATGQTGRGVTITDVRRMYDAFTTLQLRTEKSYSSYWDTYSGVSGSIETIFNETSNTGMATAISNFFNDWQSVANNPQGSVERTQLLSDANYLGSRIGNAYNGLNDQRTQLYKSSQDLVTQVNNITKQISDLNGKIAQSPGSLDLQDKRDTLVESLNKIAAVNTVQDSSGRYNVYLGGAALVTSSGSFDMSVALDTNNNMQFSLSTTGTATNVNAQLGGGQLKANLDMRDTVVTGYMSSLNAFAIDLSDKVNNINSQGYGLDGSTGNNFFNSLVNITNPAVGAMSSVQVSDVAAYGSTINNQYRIDYSNAAAAGYQQEGASGIYWRVQQSSDGGTTWSAVPTSSVTVTADSAAIPAFRTLSFNGLTMKIDGTQTAIGAAGSGTFDVKLNRNAAASLAASIIDLSKIAAAQTAANLPGDNTNAQAIAGLVSQNFIANTDPVTFYSNMVSTAGADAQSANTYVSFETAMVTQLESQRQSASGVNMDEEAVNMIQFQKSYEAAAKMISVGNDLLATLMGLIR